MATWLSRQKGAPAPRRRRSPDGNFEPLANELQTALPADYSAIDMSVPGYTLGHQGPQVVATGLKDKTKGILFRILSKIGMHGQALTNFRVSVGTAEQTILQYNPARCYLLLTNPGAVAVNVAFGRTADLQTSLTLAAGGGFFEPILGTVTSVHAISTVPAELIVIEGIYSWAGGTG